MDCGFRRNLRRGDFGGHQERIVNRRVGGAEAVTLQRYCGADSQEAADARCDDSRGDFAVLPIDIYHKAASCHQAFVTAVLQIVGQGGQQVNRAVVALEEHFGDAGAESKVAVDLERRVRVKEVRICATLREIAPTGVGGQEGEHILDDFVGVVAIEETRPKVYLPTN